MIMVMMTDWSVETECVECFLDIFGELLILTKVQSIFKVSSVNHYK